MAGSDNAKVLTAFVEWQAHYRAPNFELQSRGPAVTSAVFQAFQPWNINLANVSAKPNPTNAGEVGIIFSLLGSSVVFSVGVGAATLLVRDANWSQEQLIGQIATAGLQALQSTAAIAIERHVVSVAMHLQPERSLREVSAGFVGVISPALSSPAIKARGFSVYAEDYSWVVDASALYKEALFVKIVRSFGPEEPYPDMARALRGDQTELLGALHLTVE